MKRARLSRFLNQAGVLGLVGMVFSWFLVGGCFLIFVFIKILFKKEKI